MTDSIVILGAGNLATHLIKALINNKLNIIQIYNRHIDKARKIIQENNFSCEITDNLDVINKDASLYFFALSDNAIIEVVDKIGKINGTAIHCSGTIPISVFQKISDNYASFYPFQTFSSIKNYKINFSQIPIFVETANEKTENKMIEIAKKLSCKYYIVNEKKRQSVHLSGVFAANFANHCIAIAQDILSENNIPIEILNPLLEQSYKKTILIPACEAQTGPARRNDNKIIEKHLSSLKDNEINYKIYKLLSESIIKKYYKNE